MDSIGIYFVLLIQCIEALLYRAKMRNETLFKPMPITAAVLFMTITTVRLPWFPFPPNHIVYRWLQHWILDLWLAFEAFIQPVSPGYCVTPTSLNPAERVYLNLPDPKNILTSAFYVLTTLVGDGFMVRPLSVRISLMLLNSLQQIYRLYIVWGRNRFIIIPPIILCIALAGSWCLLDDLSHCLILDSSHRRNGHVPFLPSNDAVIPSCGCLDHIVFRSHLSVSKYQEFSFEGGH